MRILTGLISLGRLVFGVSFIANPKLMDQGWIGRPARLPGAQVLARGIGARDVAIGLGGIQATVRNDGSARPWMAAGAICDAVDFGATWAAGNRIPHSARTAVLAIAAGGTILSTIAALGSREGAAHSAPVGGQEFTEAGAVPTETVGVA